jgi:hypothetical protein
MALMRRLLQLVVLVRVVAVLVQLETVATRQE